MRIRSGLTLLLATALLPLLSGAGCSTNAVAQAGATTLVNSTVTNLVNLIFASLGEG